MIVTTATPDHLDGLLRLEDLFESGPRWSEATWLGEFGHNDRHLLVALHEASVVGAAVFRQAGDVVDLDRIAVAPAWRRRGLARALVLGGVDWARRRGTTRLLLEVHHGNAPAIALYRSHGFQPVARRDNYYGAGEHADVMQLALDSDDHLVGEEGEQR